MRSRREFLQLAAVSASYFAAMPNFARSAAQQRLTQNDLLNFDSKGQVDREIYKFNERIEIRLSRELSPGRSRMNCTVKDDEGNWRWFGHQFYF